MIDNREINRKFFNIERFSNNDNSIQINKKSNINYFYITIIFIIVVILVLYFFSK